jgi:hypothetical protein
MSIRHPPKAAEEHPEILAIALEVTINPGRRKYYSPLVLSLADIALQNLLDKAVSENRLRSINKQDQIEI